MSLQVSLYKLEELFATNLSSPIFTVLADRYYRKKQYKKAEKVCLLGLKQDPNNHIGQYILAKIHLINNNLSKSEKLLISVVNNDMNNINALITLIEVAKSLNRSETTYNKYIEMAYSILPDNKQIQLMHNKINRNTVKKKSTSKKERTVKESETIYINEKMATKTMYELLMKQQKNELAKQILLLMKKNKKNLKFVNAELKKHIKK